MPEQCEPISLHNGYGERSSEMNRSGFGNETNLAMRSAGRNEKSPERRDIYCNDVAKGCLLDLLWVLERNLKRTIETRALFEGIRMWFIVFVFDHYSDFIGGR